MCVCIIDPHVSSSATNQGVLTLSSSLLPERLVQIFKESIEVGEKTVSRASITLHSQTKQQH